MPTPNDRGPHRPRTNIQYHMENGWAVPDQRSRRRAAPPRRSSAAPPPAARGQSAADSVSWR